MKEEKALSPHVKTSGLKPNAMFDRKFSCFGRLLPPKMHTKMARSLLS